MRKKTVQEGVKSLLSISHRAPLEEPGCRVVDAVQEMLLAACRGEFIDEGFAAVCGKYGLLQYKSEEPSDIGILNFLSPLRDAAFHSRKHREAELEYQGELEYRESMKVRDEAQRATERVVEVNDRIDARYRCSSVSVSTGLFDTALDTRMSTAYINQESEVPIGR